MAPLAASFQSRLETFGWQETWPKPKAKSRRASTRGKKNSNVGIDDEISWPLNSPVPYDLAFAGFVFRPTSNSPDNCQCFECGCQLDGWEAEDIPAYEHLTHSPECGYAITICLRLRLGDPERVDEDPLGPRMLEARRATFGDYWNLDTSAGFPSVEKMVEAGWYYDPGEDGPDGVTCPYCSISVEGWEAGDDPLEEHRRRADNAQNDCLFFTLKEVYHPANIPFTGADAPVTKAKGKGKRASSKARSSTASNISATGKKAVPKAKATKTSRAKTTKLKKRESAMTEVTDITEMTAVTDNTQLDFESDERPVAKGRGAKKAAPPPSDFGSDDLPVEPQPAKSRVKKKAPPPDLESDDLVEPIVIKAKGKKKAAAKPAPVADFESDDAPPPVKGRVAKKFAPLAVPMPDFSSDDMPPPAKSKATRKIAPSVADSDDMMAPPAVPATSKRTRKAAETGPEEVVAPPKRQLTKKALASLEVVEQVVEQPAAKSRPVTRKSLATDISTDDAPKAKQPAKRGRPPKRPSEQTEVVLDSFLIDQIAPAKQPAKRGRPQKRPSEVTESMIEPSVVEEQEQNIVKQPVRRGRPPKRPSEVAESMVEASVVEEQEQSIVKQPAKRGRPPKRPSEVTEVTIEQSVLEEREQNTVKPPAKRGRPPKRLSEQTASILEPSVIEDPVPVKQPAKRGRPPKRLSTQSQSKVDLSTAEPDVTPESAPEPAREPSPEPASAPAKPSKGKTAKTTKRKSDQMETQDAPARRTSKRLRPSDVDESVKDTLPDTLPTFSMPEEALHQSTPPHIFCTTPPRRFSPPIAASAKKAYAVSTSTPLRPATVRASTPPNATANANANASTSGMKTPDVMTPSSFHHANKPHWSPIDIERFFEKENLPAIDIKELTSPEKRMTVEQFLMHEAARQEKVLRDQMLRQIDTLDVAYNRALAVVDEMDKL